MDTKELLCKIGFRIISETHGVMFSKISIDTDFEEHKSDILEVSLIDTHILYFSSKISNFLRKKEEFSYLPTKVIKSGSGEGNQRIFELWPYQALQKRFLKY
jgi:hypothetical protein